jgi:hypothetical protein
MKTIRDELSEVPKAHNPYDLIVNNATYRRLEALERVNQNMNTFIILNSHHRLGLTVALRLDRRRIVFIRMHIKNGQLRARHNGSSHQVTKQFLRKAVRIGNKWLNQPSPNGKTLLNIIKDCA